MILLILFNNVKNFQILIADRKYMTDIGLFRK
jgi:hypothetical protein